MNNNFAQLWRYLLFICRRERVTSTIWIVCVSGFAALLAALYPSLLPTQAEINQLAASMTNPAMVAMMGNVYGMEKLTQASVMAQECLIWLLIAIAIMNIFLVNRHTRVDEELGRQEMFRALPVGRLTGSLATIKFAFTVNLLISILTAVLLIAVDIGGTTVNGAFAYGLAIGAVGILFASLTLLAAQLFSTAHAVSVFGFAMMVLFYILRALGDVKNSVLSSISPLGLGLKVEAFYGDNFLPLVILLAEALVLTIIALAIGAGRDHGAGVLPARKGRAHASSFLRTPLGYAWRISRGLIIGWGVGIFLLGASYGSVISDINAFVEGNEMMQQFLDAGGANTLLDSYVALIFMMMSMVVSVPVVLTAMKIHGEEKRGRLEQIFAKAVPRIKLYGSFLTVAVIGSLVLELLLAAGLVAASGGELSFGPVFQAGLCYLPAIWAITGLAVLLVGFLPKMAALIWAVFGYSFIVMYFGKIMELPEWTAKITPFGNIPQLPVQEFTAVPLIILSLIAVALSTFGLLRYKERDIG